MWQETLLTIQDFREYCNKCDHQCSTYPTICREKAQAEKSYKAGVEAGRREVVEWIKNNSAQTFGLDYEAHRHISIVESWWQKQLKSWGLEG